MRQGLLVGGTSLSYKGRAGRSQGPATPIIKRARLMPFTGDLPPAPPLPPSRASILPRWRRDALGALQLLTRLPVRHEGGGNPAERARSMRAFALAGVAVGLIGGAAFWIAHLINLPPLACALIALAATMLTTGALHEDGLADCADGFGGGRDAQSKLRIMRDHQIGAYGALALIVSVGLRAAALSGLSGEQAIWALIGVHALARGLLPWVGALPPARNDGLGLAYAGPGTGIVLQAALVGAIVSLIALGPVAGIVALAAGAFGVWLVRTIALRQIGGFTGDVYGAAEQAAETLALLAVAALW
jgi:adenosylcobinamide-GDP ribazoletransferase